MHPGVYDAGALAIMSYSTDKPQFGKPKMTPEIKQKVDDIYKAMNMIIALAPDAGTYANEADYFQKNWQQVFWGSNYSKLLKIKTNMIQMVYFIVIIVLVVNIGNRMACVESDS